MEKEIEFLINNVEDENITLTYENFEFFQYQPYDYKVKVSFKDYVDYIKPKFFEKFPLDSQKKMINNWADDFYACNNIDEAFIEILKLHYEDKAIEDCKRNYDSYE